MRLPRKIPIVMTALLHTHLIASLWDVPGTFDYGTEDPRFESSSIRSDYRQTDSFRCHFPIVCELLSHGANRYQKSNGNWIHEDLRMKLQQMRFPNGGNQKKRVLEGGVVLLLRTPSREVSEFVVELSGFFLL